MLTEKEKLEDLRESADYYRRIFGSTLQAQKPFQLKDYEQGEISSDGKFTATAKIEIPGLSLNPIHSELYTDDGANAVIYSIYNCEATVEFAKVFLKSINKGNNIEFEKALFDGRNINFFWVAKELYKLIGGSNHRYLANVLAISNFVHEFENPAEIKDIMQFPVKGYRVAELATRDSGLYKDGYHSMLYYATKHITDMKPLITSLGEFFVRHNRQCECESLEEALIITNLVDSGFQYAKTNNR